MKRNASATIEDRAAGILSTFNTYYSEFTAQGIDVNSLLRQLLTIKGFLFFFDYLYRLLQTAKLVARFWGRGVVRLPKIRLQSKRQVMGEVDARWFTYMNWFLKLVPFIWFQLLMILGLLTVIIWATIGTLALLCYTMLYYDITFTDNLLLIQFIFMLHFMMQ